MSDTDGNIEIVLAGHSWTIKCSWKAVADIQDDLGYGMVMLAQKIAMRNYGLRELAVIVYRGLLAAETQPRPKLDAVCEQVFKTGLLNKDLIEAVTKFCQYALNGGIPPGEDGAATENNQNQTTSPSAA